MNDNYLIQSGGKDSDPGSLVLDLDSGAKIGLAWFTIVSYELILSDLQIYISAGDSVYHLTFMNEEGEQNGAMAAERVFDSLCRRSTVALNRGVSLVSIAAVEKPIKMVEEEDDDDDEFIDEL
jgi:hypothetical protein